MEPTTLMSVQKSPDIPVLLGNRSADVQVGNSPKPKADEEAKIQNVSKDMEGQKAETVEGGCRLPLLSWFRLLWRLYGYFAPLGMLSYGVQQYFARGIGEFSYKYYMMDTLKLDGATMGRFLTVAHVPWNVKPVLGILSDTVPLLGFHKTSYLVIACVFSLLAYLWFGCVALGTSCLVLFMSAVNFGLAFSDLVIDATAARLGKEHSAHASDLQCALRSAEATGGITAGAVKGWLVELISPQGVALVNTLSAVSVLVPALLGWLPEERLSSQRCTANLSEFRKHPLISLVAVLLSAMAMGLSLLQLFVEDVRVRAAITVVCAVGVAVSVVKVLSGISPYFGQTALFIFLRLVLQPGLGEAMFVWLTRFPEGPQLSAQLMGVTDCFGQSGLLLGLVCYRSFMTNWSYRKIFLVGQIAYLISQLLDICLVMRWNQLIGIPDFLFYVGDTAFDLAVSKLFYVPLVVLAYKVCPLNLEATLFATLMALNNIGVDTGKFLGVSLCELWGIVDGNFDYLVHGLVTKALCRLLPIPLIFLLIPRQLTPNDPVPLPDAKDNLPADSMVDN
eukprot:s2511_g5.t2